jgi:pimeloyl-ACP methyl ester carboxylesterase
MNTKRAISITTAVLAAASFTFAQTPTAPPQPASGPGGADYAFTVIQTYGPYTVSWGSDQTDTYYIYQPAGPVPTSAPAVLFLHGYGADTPQPYQIWINQLVQKGYTVVWALYDQGASETFVGHELADWTDALNRIAKSPNMVQVTVDQSGVMEAGVVGHSAGAFSSFALAALIDQPSSGLAPFRSIVAIEPGQGQIPTYDLSTINSDTAVVIVVGDQDKPKRRCTASQVWAALPSTTGNTRNFLEVISDASGTPQQIGNHYFSLTDTYMDTVPPPVSVDDRDYNVSWKLSVSALNCAIKGFECEVAFGNGNSQQINMGKWSNGTPVTPLLYVSDPVTQFQSDCQNSDSVPDQFDAPY